MSEELVREVKSLMRSIQDFPKPGILFYDITTVLENGPAFARIIEHYKDRYAGQSIDRFIGIESRGFIFASAIAYALKTGQSLVRKPGKLPYKTDRAEYSLEYGTDAVEMHVDTVGPGQRVVIVDDLLATGGTAAATVGLVEKLGAEIVECTFLVELADLDGRAKLGDTPTYCVVTY